MSNKKNNGRSHHSGAPVEITNPEIEKLCVEFHARREENLLIEILQKLSAAQVLAPVQTKKIGNVVMMAPMIGTNPNGDRLIQVFTSRPMIPPQIQTLDFRSWSFRQVCEIVGMEKNNILAIVVNPGPNQLPVPRLTAQRIAEGKPLGKEKVANDEAEELLAKMLTSSDSDTLNSLINALLRARVLIPYNQFEKDGKKLMAPVLAKSDAGKPVLNVFTSDSKTSVLPQGVIPVPMGFIDAVKIANQQSKAMPDMAGILLNPGEGKAIILNTHLLSTIEEQYQNLSDGESFQLPKADDKHGLTDNSDVEEAIRVCRENEGSADATHVLTDLLVRKRLFIPGSLNQEEEGKKRVSMKIYKTPKGDNVVLHAYTSREKLPAELAASEILVMDFVDIASTAADLADSRQDFIGIVMNPGPEGIVVPKLIAAAVRDQKDALKKGEAFVMPQPVQPKPQKIQLNEAQAAEQLKNLIAKMPEQQQPAMEKFLFATAYLPAAFFEDSTAFVEKLLTDREDYIDSLFEDCYSNKRMYPYLPEDFPLMVLNSEGKEVIRLDLPETETHVPGEYCRIYMIWDNVAGEGHYYGIAGLGKVLKIMEHVQDQPRAILRGDAPAEGQELQYLLRLSSGQSEGEEVSSEEKPGDLQ